MEDLEDKTDPAVAEENGTPADGDGVVVDLASRRRIVKVLRLVKSNVGPEDLDQKREKIVTGLKDRLNELLVKGKIPGDKPEQG